MNYHELAKTVDNINSPTVEKYLELLEEAFVIFKLPAFKRNLLNELKKVRNIAYPDHKTHLINQNNHEDFIVLGTKQGGH